MGDTVVKCSQKACIPLENTGEQSKNRVASGSYTFYEENKQTKCMCKKMKGWGDSGGVIRLGIQGKPLRQSII